MKIIAVVNGSVLTIFLCGELGHHEAIDVISRIRDEMERGTYMQIILDMDGLTFMDSSGIGMIMGRYKKARTLGGRVCAFGVNAQILRIIEMSGIDRIIKLTPDLDRALRLMDK